ncbi:MAG: hypothetical protein KBB01_01905 [Candidatus Omnitrophica bacterium]|jgi:hypothetical protein|nr:hypothetical protein [Candidatus Omnitrophota bacterium]
MEAKYKDKEVNLLSYIRITVKKRKIFITIVAIFIVAAFIKSFTIKPTYKVIEIIALPTIPKDAGENLMLAVSFKTRIEEGVYHHLIKERLGISSNIPSLTVEVPKNEEIIKINTQIAKNQVDLAIKILDTLYLLLKEEVQPVLERNINEIDEKINLLNISIERAELDKKNIEQQVELYTKQLNRKQSSIDFSESQIKAVEERIISLLKRIEIEHPKDIIQEGDIIYSEKFDKLLSDLKSEKKYLLENLGKEKDDTQDIELKIETLKGNKLSLDKESEAKRVMIASLQKKKNSFVPIERMQPPQVHIINTRAIKLKLILKYFFCGLILGIAAVIIVDFYQKNRDAILGQDQE